MFKKLTVLAVVWTFGLVVLGAYVRLSNAGLGCPDWPGCYGHPTPIHAIDEISAAQVLSPDGPVSVDKAWKEMVHRYVASGLGLLVLGMGILAVLQRRMIRQSPTLAVAIFFVVCLQGAFGAWTVTLKLRPAIVTGHLVFGMTTLALLLWLALREREWPRLMGAPSRLRVLAIASLIALIVQMLLGGWVSTNYAALACVDFPTCQGAMVPAMHFGDAFALNRELGMAADGHVLNMADLTAIHWLHRLWAVVAFVLLGLLSHLTARQTGLRALGIAIAVALFAQVLLGISNVVLQLPLPIAVLHNAGAALLLCLLITLNYRLAQSR